VLIGTDYTCSCKSNYHTITTTTVPIVIWQFKLKSSDCSYDCLSVVTVGHFYSVNIVIKQRMN